MTDELSKAPNGSATPSTSTRPNDPALAESSAEEEAFELTPEIVQYENRRNDVIIAVGVLVFAFFLGSFREAGPEIWLRFKAGQQIAEQFPNFPKTDNLSYTAAGQPWTNPSWAFDWAIYQVYARFGAGALIAIKALICALVAAPLLLIRHRGPTLLWASLCAILALAGMSMRLTVGPEVITFGLLGLLLLLWHQAKYRGRFAALYLSVPLAVLWANVDLTYYLAPIVLALLGIGELIQSFLPSSFEPAGARLARGKIAQVFVLAVLCLLAGLATPYGAATLTLPFEWFAKVLPQAPGYDKQSMGWSKLDTEGFWRALAGGDLSWGAYCWVALAVMAFGSFLLNLKISVSRLSLVLLAVAMPLVAYRFIGPSAILLAVALSLNGQEFFLARWGTETRIDKGWVLWSQAARAFMILFVFFAIFAGLTGRVQNLIGRFGYGIDESQYMVEAAEWLDEVKPQGRGFAFFDRLSSYQSWAPPNLPTFEDSRWQVFADPSLPAFGNPADYKLDGVLQKFSRARNALRESKPAEWKAIFDEYNITYVIFDPQESGAREVLFQMFNSPDLAPLLITDQAVIFGRTDDTVDKALVEAKRIRANDMVFKEPRPLPDPTLRYVIPPGFIDMVWRYRYVMPPGFITGTIYSSPSLFPRGLRTMEEPGSDYLAVSSLRNAVANNSDSPDAYLQLAIAYENIFRREGYALALERQEQIREFEKKRAAASEKAAAEKAVATTSVADGKSDKPSTPGKPAMKEGATKDVAASKTPATPALSPPTTNPSESLVMPPSSMSSIMRHYQIMTALQNAVAAGDTDGRANFELFQVCRDNSYYDMALHHLQIALERLPKPAADALRKQFLALFEAEVGQRRTEYEKLVADRQKELEGAGADIDRPLERAELAFQLQLPMLAVEQLESASAFGPEVMQAAPFAGEMFLLLGLTEKAEARFRTANIQRRMPAGEWDWFMAQIQVVSGKYEEAKKFLEHAIAESRRARISRSLSGFETRMRGGQLISIPFETNAMLEDAEREALYLFTLGLMRIEMGEPHLAPAEFQQALEASPRFPMRPIIEYYWPLLTDKKLPAELPPFDLENEIALRIDKPKPAEEGDTKKTPAPETPKPAKDSPKAAPAKQEPSKAEEKSAPAKKEPAKAEPKSTPPTKAEPKKSEPPPPAPKSEPKKAADPKAPAKSPPEAKPAAESKAAPKKDAP